MLRSFLITIATLQLSCNPAELKTDDGLQDSHSNVAESRDWITWDTCSQVPGDNPCNFSFKNQHGKDVELYDHYGKVIIVDLSTMWCGICRNIAPVGEQIVLDYGPENVVWLTLLVENSSGMTPDANDLQEWVSTYGLTSDVLAADRSIIDSNGITGYPVSGWPTIVVINREMVVHQGVTGWSEGLLRSWLGEVL